jgi:aerobic carbon-monoxide dehydrogenase medium subunit
VEKALTGQPSSPEAASRAAAEVVRDLGDDLLGDIYASAEYRKAMAPVYVGRALQRALERAA